LPIPVHVNATTGRLPDGLEATVFYIVSEALTNIVKHAEASKANVSVTVERNTLRFEVIDNGRGGADPAAGTGILGLRDRAEAAGGTLFVVSPPGRGTVVTAQIPLSGG
jgi:signal transduction histidine kinase